MLTLLLDAADGRFPDVDGGVTVVPSVDEGRRAVVAFTGHAVVACDEPPDAVADKHPDGFGGALAPTFLLWLAGPGGTVGVNDVTLVARGLGDGTLPERHDLGDHYRVRHATDLRQDVRVHGDERGFVTISTGLAGRIEMSIELLDSPHGRGSGRSLITEARRLVDPDRWLFAAVSPGNARSLRAFLATGFVPIGSEVIITPAGMPAGHG